MKYQLLDPYIRYFFKTDKYMCSKVNTYADDYRLFLGIIDGCVLICWEYFCIFTNCHISLQNPTDKGFSIFCFHESPLIATYCHSQMS